jgi:hypothetical protein
LHQPDYIIPLLDCNYLAHPCTAAGYIIVFLQAYARNILFVLPFTKELFGGAMYSIF